MARLVCVVPGQWRPLTDALEAAGHEVYAVRGGAPTYALFEEWARVEKEVHALGPMAAAAGWAPDGRGGVGVGVGVVDQHKTLRALGLTPEEATLADAALKDGLLEGYRMRRIVHTVAGVRGPVDAVVTTCTYDAWGRGAWAGARDVRAPLVHVQHACAGAEPADAWYAAQTPGDVVCVPGERDAAWWTTCLAANPQAPGEPLPAVEVTGHPLWDVHWPAAREAYAAAAKPRPPKGPDEPVRVLWACESGANAVQTTAAVWGSRDVPERAWRAFLAAMREAPLDRCAVVLKVRGGEGDDTCANWMAEAVGALGADRVTITERVPAEVLPGVDVVVSQDSSLSVEAAAYGVPSVSITRDGGQMFSPTVWPPRPALVVDACALEGVYLAAALAAALRRLVRPLGVLARGAVVTAARRYNRGFADGRATERVVEVVGLAAAAGRKGRAA